MATPNWEQEATAPVSDWEKEAQGEVLPQAPSAAPVASWEQEAQSPVTTFFQDKYNKIATQEPLQTIPQPRQMEAMAKALPPQSLGEAVTRTAAEVKAPSLGEIATPVGLGYRALENFGSVKRNIIDPLVVRPVNQALAQDYEAGIRRGEGGAFGKAAALGRDAIATAISPFVPNPVKAADLAEFIQRNTGAIMLGQMTDGDTPNVMREDRLRRALSALDDFIAVGEVVTPATKLLSRDTKAALAQSSMDQLGKLPIMLVSLPSRFLQATSTLGKIVSGAIRAGTENVIGDAAIAGTDPTTSFATGALVGGALHTAGAGVVKGVQALDQMRVNKTLQNAMTDFVEPPSQIQPPEFKPPQGLAESFAAGRATTMGDVEIATQALRRPKPAPKSPAVEAADINQVEQAVVAIMHGRDKKAAAELLLKDTPEGNPTKSTAVIVDSNGTPYKYGMDDAGNYVRKSIDMDTALKLRDEGYAALGMVKSPLDKVEPKPTHTQAARAIKMLEILERGDANLSDEAVVFVSGREGGLEIWDINDPRLHAVELSHRNLVEYKSNGKTEHGFLISVPGEAAPRPAIIPVDGVESSVKQVTQVTDMTAVRKLNKHELSAKADEIMEWRQSGKGEPAPLPPAKPPPPPPPADIAPPPAPPPASIPPSTATVIAATQRLGDNGLRTLMKAVLPKTMWVGDALNLWMQGVHISNGIRESGDQVKSYILRKFNLKDNPQFNKDMYEVMQGRMAKGDFAVKYPELDAQARLELNTMLSELELNAQLLNQYAPSRFEELVDIEGFQGINSSRLYAKHLLGAKENAIRVNRDKALVAQLEKAVYDNLFSKDKELTKEVAEVKSRDFVQELIGNPDFASQIVRQLDNKQASILRSKADVAGLVDQLYVNYKDTKYKGIVEGLRKARIEGKDLKPIVKKLLAEGEGAIGGQFLRDLQGIADSTELSALFRKALGEIHDGPFVLAHTLIQQRAKLAEFRFWEAFVSGNKVEGGAIATADSPVVMQDTANEWIPLEKYASMVGERNAGLYIRKDAFEALIEKPIDLTPMTGSVGKIVSTLVKLQKINQIAGGGASTFLTQVLGGATGVLYSGLDPWRADPVFTRALLEGFQDWRAHRKSPLYGKRTGLFNEALHMGLTTSSIGTVEHKIETREFESYIRKQIDAGVVKSPFDLMHSAFTWASTKGRKALNYISAAHAVVDSIMKYATWRALMEQNGLKIVDGDVTIGDRNKVLKFLGAHGHPGLGPDTLIARAKATASQRVADSFPMHNRVAPLQKALMAGGGVITDKYIGTKSELMRATLSLGQRLARNEPGLRNVMLKHALTLSAMAGAFVAWRNANGVTGEVVAENDKRRTNLDKMYHPTAVALPMKDANGNVIFLDILPKLMSELSLLNGSMDNPVYKRIIGNLVVQNLGPLLQESAQTVLATYGFSDFPIEPKMRKAQMDTYKLLEMATRNGLLPSVLNTIPNIMQQGGLIGTPKPNQPVTTPGVTAGKLMGLPLSSPLTPEQKGQVDRLEVYGTEAEVRAAKNLKPGVRSGISPSTRDDSLKRAVDMKKRTINKENK